MFNRALSWFTTYSAPLLDDTNDVENPPLSTAAPMVDDLENPLIQPAATNDDDDAVPESPRNSVGNRIVSILKSPTFERLLIVSAFLILIGIAVYHFVLEVNRISDDDFQLDSVVVSSFNVSKGVPAGTTWDTQLSLTLADGDFDELDVRYEAPRIWLYSRDGFFVAMTTPSIEYSPDGKRMVLHAVFDGIRRETSKGQVVRLGMVVETNAMRRVVEVEVRALVMIDCSDLKIEFSKSSSYGTLVDGAKSCKVHVCPLEEHPLYDGADECTTSSSRLIKPNLH